MVSGGDGTRSPGGPDGHRGLAARRGGATDDQRLLRRLSPGRGRAAGRPARHDPLESHRRLRAPLSEGEAGRRPHLHPRRRCLDLGGHHRRHRPGPGPDRGRPGRGHRPRRRPAAGGPPAPARRPVAVLGAAGAGRPDGPVRRPDGLEPRQPGPAADRRAAGRPGRHEPAQLRPRLHRRDRRHPGQGGRAPAPRGRPNGRRDQPHADRPGGARAWASATPNGCAAPSCAPSASRRRRSDAPREASFGRPAP